MSDSIQAKKSFGQHFLVADRCCERILRLAEILPNELVIEIGAGTGRLTGHLLRAGALVTAIELDRDLIPILERLTSSAGGRLEVVETNVLRTDWIQLIRGPTVKVVGNLPYNISTRVIREMIPVRDRFHSLTFMLQKEVAERILAEPGDRNYGYFSVFTAFYFQKRRGFDVPPGSFRPMPRVQSHVLQLAPKRASAEPDPDVAEKLLAASFRSPRKTILNNLKSLSQTDCPWEVLLEGCGIAAGLRPHQVTPDQFGCLAKVL